MKPVAMAMTDRIPSLTHIGPAPSERAHLPAARGREAGVNYTDEWRRRTARRARCVEGHSSALRVTWCNHRGGRFAALRVRSSSLLHHRTSRSIL
jgi:hypothetical protein